MLTKFSSSWKQLSFLVCCLACFCMTTFVAAETPKANTDKKIKIEKPKDAAHDFPKEKKIDFATQIRPILSDACFHCHGPAEEDRAADLRLDVQESATAMTDGLAAILPGNSKKSVVMERILSHDPDVQMPPEESGKKLTKEQIELIRKWIDQGAPWADHWAFVPPEKPASPKVKNEKWIKNPIDTFVLAKLEENDLKPSDQADKLKLMRRLYLDLIGLPPTLREIKEYEKDKSPNAYEKLVDKLLSSKHYGEKWGRHWLDAARYSDSDGFEKDKPRFVWHYRDWVVNALNRDLPYDQFIIEQLAGDLLPNATQDQIVATGFLRNSMLNEEGGADPEQFRMEAMFDRMDAVGKSILGLTIQCTQCHTHKYDPIKHDEYYSMFAFLNNSFEHSSIVYTPKERLQIDGINSQISSITRLMKQSLSNWEERMANWEKEIKQNRPNWEVLAIENSSGSNSQRYFQLEDKSILAQGYAPSRHTGTFSVTVDNPKMRSFRLELLTDPNLPANGPGRGLMGKVVLSDFKLQITSVKDPKKNEYIKFEKVTADYSNDLQKLEEPYVGKKGEEGYTGSVELSIDNDSSTGWGIDAGPSRRNQSRKAVYVANKQFGYEGGTVLKFYLVQMHGGANSNDNQSLNLGRFRISALDSDNVEADPVPRRVRQIVAIPKEKRTRKQIETVFKYWRTTVPEWESENEQIESILELHPDGTTQLVMKERPEPRKTYLLDRGEFLKPKHEVKPDVPGFLNPFPKDTPKNRLSFAKWLTSPEAPTVSRAAVNRAWQAFFGKGIVSTSEDLGSQGEAPSHPKLIDWLAVELIENGWSMKQLHKTIVMSATYQQSSKVDPKLIEVDPYNRLLARGPRFRVDGEIVRDIALASSGLLNLEMGGPGVYPPSPAFLYLPPLSYGTKTWDEDMGEDRYRRSLYTFRFRSVPNPVLQNFDTPNGDASTVRRDRSNTPLQSLTTLNETLFQECARNLAIRTYQMGGKKDPQKLDFAFRSCLTRKPTKQEVTVLTNLLNTQKSRIKNGQFNAYDLLKNEQGVPVKIPTGIDKKQLAPWIIVSRVILNLDETITKE